ncbi:hypothetical protein BSLA_02f4019 [Burkholderia stabilis]|nr:hypothetical protein BSLA_02f4019 [Burkholderia stabilis]
MLRRRDGDVTQYLLRKRSNVAGGKACESFGIVFDLMGQVYEMDEYGEKCEPACGHAAHVESFRNTKNDAMPGAVHDRIF